MLFYLFLYAHLKWLIKFILRLLSSELKTIFYCYVLIVSLFVFLSLQLLFIGLNLQEMETFGQERSDLVRNVNTLSASVTTDLSELRELANHQVRRNYCDFNIIAFYFSRLSESNT